MPNWQNLLNLELILDFQPHKKSQTTIFSVTIMKNTFLITGHGLGPLNGIFQRTEYSVSDREGSCIGEDSLWVPMCIMHI